MAILVIKITIILYKYAGFILKILLLNTYVYKVLTNKTMLKEKL